MYDNEPRRVYVSERVGLISSLVRYFSWIVLLGHFSFERRDRGQLLLWASLLSSVLSVIIRGMAAIISGRVHLVSYERDFTLVLFCFAGLNTHTAPLDPDN